MNKINNFLILIRDLFFLCILILLIQIEFKKHRAFILKHKNSLIHELDADFIEQLRTAQHLTYQLEEKLLGNSIDTDYGEKVALIKKQLTMIEERYKQNSPGLILLGPLGTASIIIKEKKLQTQLLELLNQLGLIIHTISNCNSSFDYAITMNNALEQNKKLLLTMNTLNH